EVQNKPSGMRSHAFAGLCRRGARDMPQIASGSSRTLLVPGVLKLHYSMDLTRLDIAPLGDSALRIACGPLDDAETAARVAEVAARLCEVPIEGVRDIVPAWTSVALFYAAPLVAELTGCESPYEHM